jgi:hypothetical protein
MEPGSFDGGIGDLSRPGIELSAWPGAASWAGPGLPPGRLVAVGRSVKPPVGASGAGSDPG